MFDLIVSGGKAVMPSGSAERVDIGVSGGKIATVGGPGASQTSALQELSMPQDRS